MSGTTRSIDERELIVPGSLLLLLSCLERIGFVMVPRNCARHDRQRNKDDWTRSSVCRIQSLPPFRLWRKSYVFVSIDQRHSRHHPSCSRRVHWLPTKASNVKTVLLPTRKRKAKLLVAREKNQKSNRISFSNRSPNLNSFPYFCG